MNQPVQQSEYNDLSEFLVGTEWEGASISPMSADMGLRRYMRLEKEGKHALFMDMSRSGILETGLKEYVEVAVYLDSLDVHVPEIYHYDLESGLAVIEVVGAESFGDKKNQGHDPHEIYQKATDILVQIKNGAAENTIPLVGYKKTLIRERLRQFVDYYVPAVTDLTPDPKLVEEFETILNDIALSLPPCPMGFCHADYHLENLMWCPDEADGYGLIDFQDAFWGFKGYDLLNLLEDARQSVPEKIKQEMRARYCESMSAQEREVFDQWYALMSMHFHCRVIGLFIKFARENAREDRGVEFLAHIPRLQGYIKHNLENPVLAPLKEFMKRHNIRFDVAPTV